MRAVFKVASAVAVLTAISFAVFIESTQIEVTHPVIGAPNERLRPIRILQVSDLHIQSIGRREQSVLAKINDLKPDLLIFSGDVIDDAAKLSVLERFLSLLDKGRMVAVLGNWEHWSDVNFDELRALYSRQGVSLLINQHVSYRINDRDVVVTGLDDFTAGHPDLGMTNLKRQDGETHLLVQHSPGWFETLEALAIPSPFTLCLSGHTHGGQVAPFGKALWRPRGSGNFVVGRYDISLCPLYVSRGVGTSIAPLRIGARPEIALFNL